MLQLGIAFAASAGYYFLTLALLERYGTTGFLYALIAIAVVLAIVREFWPEISSAPVRIWREVRRARIRRPGERAPRGALGPQAPTFAAPPVVPASREEAEALFRQLKAQFERAELTPEAFQQRVAKFFFVDGEGKFWTIQPQSGEWAYYKGGRWNPGIPLGALSRAGAA